jgi:hypothetical protein
MGPRDKGTQELWLLLFLPSFKKLFILLWFCFWFSSKNQTDGLLQFKNSIFVYLVVTILILVHSPLCLQDFLMVPNCLGVSGDKPQGSRSSGKRKWLPLRAWTTANLGTSTCASGPGSFPRSSGGLTPFSGLGIRTVCWGRSYYFSETRSYVSS